LSTLKDDDVYSAILLIPKSYLPLLEAFKSRKIAKAIKILPADIKWIDGKIVAMSEQIVDKKGRRQSEPERSASKQKNYEDEILNPQADMSLNNLIPLLLMQGVAESMAANNPVR
jgi:hypothetical protein